MHPLLKLDSEEIKKRKAGSFNKKKVSGNVVRYLTKEEIEEEANKIGEHWTALIPPACCASTMASHVINCIERRDTTLTYSQVKYMWGRVKPGKGWSLDKPGTLFIDGANGIKSEYVYPFNTYDPQLIQEVVESYLSENSPPRRTTEAEKIIDLSKHKAKIDNPTLHSKKMFNVQYNGSSKSRSINFIDNSIFDSKSMLEHIMAEPKKEAEYNEDW